MNLSTFFCSQYALGASASSAAYSAEQRTLDRLDPWRLRQPRTYRLWHQENEETLHQISAEGSCAHSQYPEVASKIFPFLFASPRIKLILWAGWHLSDRITNEKKMRVWHWVCLNKRSCLFFKLAKNLANFNLPDSRTVSCCSSNQSVEGCHQD